VENNLAEQKRILIFTETIKNKDKMKNKLITQATGAALINNLVTEDFILGFLSSKIELTEDVKLEVKNIVNQMKKYLVDQN
jgi:hypothetical protein